MESVNNQAPLSGTLIDSKLQTGADIRKAKVLLWEPAMSGLPCQRILEFGDDLKSLREIMYNTMIAYGGIGLAAPQIGIYAAAVVTLYEDWERFMVNPVIIHRIGASQMQEGCLSLPGATGSGQKVSSRGRVKRDAQITVQYLDLEGKLQTETYDDIRSHIVQHELDHIAGKFIFDHMQPLEKSLFMRRFRNFKNHYGRDELVNVDV